MPQAMNFDELIKAFAPADEATNVTHFRNTPAATPSKSDRAAKAELQQMQDAFAALSDKHDALTAEHSKVLNHLQLVMQDKVQQDTELSRLQNDKVQSVRTFSAKNAELSDAQREIARLKQIQRQLEIKLSHKKSDLSKQKSALEKSKQESELLKIEILELKGMMEELKKDKSFINVAKTKINDTTAIVLAKVSEVLSAVSAKLSKSESKNLVGPQWVKASQALPKKDATVFVRNGNEADIAFFSAKTKKFTVNGKATKNIQDWAYATI